MGVNIAQIYLLTLLTVLKKVCMMPKFHDSMILTRETLSNINDLLTMPFITSQIASAYFAVVITIAIDIQNEGCKLLLFFLQIAQMQ